jgi:AraC-like DNA-binding protein
VIVQDAPNDALSDVLRLVDAEAIASLAISAGGEWAVRFPESDFVTFCAVRRGSCWLVKDDGTEPFWLVEGNCFAAVRGEFQLASSSEVGMAATLQVFGTHDQARQYGTGDDLYLIGGNVRFDTANGGILTDVLPSMLLISGEAAEAIHWLLDQLDKEWRRAGPGARIACNDLLRLMFIHALRTYIAELPPSSGNWLAALSDPHVGKAFEAIHANPVRNWTLADLAGLAFQSRSTFASHFKVTVGVSPIHYLTRWKIRLASARLRRGQESISSIAASLGFLSDSAFSATFRRIMGISPTNYRALHSTSGSMSATADVLSEGKPPMVTDGSIERRDPLPAR